MGEREGELIYREGHIEVRTLPRDIDAHSVWVGDDYFLLQRDVLKQFAEKTPTCLLRTDMDNYDFFLVHTLKQYQITPEEFALVLARARVRELDAQLSDAYGQMHDLRDKLAEKP